MFESYATAHVSIKKIGNPTCKYNNNVGRIIMPGFVRGRCARSHTSYLIAAIKINTHTQIWGFYKSNAIFLTFFTVVQMQNLWHWYHRGQKLIFFFFAPGRHTKVYIPDINMSESRKKSNKSHIPDTFKCNLTFVTCPLLTQYIKFIPLSNLMIGCEQKLKEIISDIYFVHPRVSDTVRTQWFQFHRGFVSPPWPQSSQPGNWVKLTKYHYLCLCANRLQDHSLSLCW